MAKLKKLDIQSVGIRKSEGEPALLTKTSLLICACLETVIDIVRMRTIRPSVFYFSQASSVRPPLTGNAHALGTRPDLMNFFLVTLQQRPSFQRFSFEQYKLFCKLSLPLEKIKQINISYHLSIYSKLESQWIVGMLLSRSVSSMSRFFNFSFRKPQSVKLQSL